MQIVFGIMVAKCKLFWNHVQGWPEVLCVTSCITNKFYADSECVFTNSKGSDDLLQVRQEQSYYMPIL